MNSTKHPRSRGFVLLIVVMLLAVLGVAVAVQLDTARGQSIDASRSRDDTAARAVAETCLDLLLAQTRGYLSTSTPPPPDFDPLLDPDGVAGSRDDFLPPSSGLAGVVSAVVAVPRDSDRPSARYRLYRFTEGSACLVRFDDNSDDAVPVPLLPRIATSAQEGPDANGGRDVPMRDRDRAIQLTAIGLFPALAATADGDVYDRAHARVTLRRVIETSGGPAIWAGDRVITAQNNAVCGLGGLTADGLTQGSDSACACGEQNIGTTPAVPAACDYTSAAAPGSMCDDDSRACEPRVIGPLKRQIDPFDPSPQNDSPLEQLIVDSGGNPDPEVDATAWLSTAAIGHPGTNGLCEFYVRQRQAIDPNDAGGRSWGSTYFAENAALAAEVYVWNHQDIGRLAGLPLAARLTRLMGTLGVTALTCRNASGATIGCPTSCDEPGGQTVPAPCDFTGSGGALTATCAAGQSPCWQLVAQLDGVANQAIGTPDTTGALLIASALPGSAPNIVGFREQTVLEGSVEVWRPLGAPVGLGGVTSSTGIKLANAAGTTQVTTWDRLCNDNKPWTTTKIVSAPPTGGDHNITKHADWQRREQFAARSAWLFENPADDGEVIFDGTRADGTAVAFGAVPGFENLPVQLFIAATGDVHFDGALGLCCPTCVCPDDVASTPVIDSMPTVNGSFADGNGRTHSCRATEGTTSIMNPPTPLTDQPIQSRLSVRAGGHCLFEKESSVVGDVMCKTVHIKGGGCFVADVFGHGACPDGRCSEPRRCNNGTCPPGQASNKLDRGPSDSGCFGLGDPTGCEEPGVCIGNSAGAPTTNIIGATFSRGDVCVRDPLTTWGQVIAQDDVRLGPDVTVNHDGTTGGGVGAIVNTVAWFESSR